MWRQKTWTKSASSWRAGLQDFSGEIPVFSWAVRVHRRHRRPGTPGEGPAIPEGGEAGIETRGQCVDHRAERRSSAACQPHQAAGRDDPEVYGHTRAGYTLDECARPYGRPAQAVAGGGYSGFFTEMVELLINAAYVKVLSRKNGSAATGLRLPPPGSWKPMDWRTGCIPCLSLHEAGEPSGLPQQPPPHYAVIVTD